ncbi:glycosyltransferase [Chenggangzhangella methanolivorans]|uniref:Glycosyltransferase n=1 Tax=Chenggangzhangella methanolivorans TaxID=1437009 RepID=A0A9E6RGY3_9HYPH|nr:glycosyltransferase [Chenggangzhangella methanolivorans]QZO01266.1 glycosyltransferase [Chenggangzhangella methanolivorans]
MAVVDIAIPCYRYGRFLRECVGSILAQSMNDVRVLIIDDASPDDSADVARELAASDPRVEALVHRENRGHIATYNEGIAWATAPYFLSLSADDYLAPGALERAAALMDARPEVVLTYGACETARPDEPAPALRDDRVDPSWRVRPGRDFVKEHCEQIRNLVPTPTAIVRTKTQKAIGGYLPSLPHAGDMEMWLRFAAHGDVADTPVPQAVYRLHGANMSADYYRNVLIDYAQRADAFDTFFGSDGRLLEDAEALRALARRRLAAAAFWTGVAQWCRGRRQTGADVLGFGLRLNPAMRTAPPFGHLMRLERVDRRLKSVFSDMIGRRAGLP